MLAHFSYRAENRRVSVAWLSCATDPSVMAGGTHATSTSSIFHARRVAIAGIQETHVAEAHSLALAHYVKPVSRVPSHVPPVAPRSLVSIYVPPENVTTLDADRMLGFSTPLRSWYPKPCYSDAKLSSAAGRRRPSSLTAVKAAPAAKSCFRCPSCPSCSSSCPIAGNCDGPASA